MIRINLLPFRAARKQENIRRQISVFVLFMIACVVCGLYYFFQLNGTVSALERIRDKKEKEKNSLRETLEKIKRKEKRLKELQEKLKVIRKLEDNKRGPVRMLVEIADAIPKDKLWLRSLVESKGILTITGTAMDNDTVALFMTNLEKAEHITAVDLASTKLQRLKKYKVNVASFSLRCKTYLHKEKTKPKGKGSK